VRGALGRPAGQGRETAPVGGVEEPLGRRGGAALCARSKRTAGSAGALHSTRVNAAVPARKRPFTGAALSVTTPTGKQRGRGAPHMRPGRRMG
jgi:hypothetical protein